MAKAPPTGVSQDLRGRILMVFHHKEGCVMFCWMRSSAAALCVFTDGEQEGLRRSTSSPDHSRSDVKGGETEPAS